jgi:hypothetical protein
MIPLFLTCLFSRITDAVHFFLLLLRANRVPRRSIKNLARATLGLRWRCDGSFSKVLGFLKRSALLVYESCVVASSRLSKRLLLHFEEAREEILRYVRPSSADFVGPVVRRQATWERKKDKRTSPLRELLDLSGPALSPILPFLSRPLTLRSGDRHSRPCDS